MTDTQTLALATAAAAAALLHDTRHIVELLRIRAYLSPDTAEPLSLSLAAAADEILAPYGASLTLHRQRILANLIPPGATDPGHPGPDTVEAPPPSPPCRGTPPWVPSSPQEDPP